MTGVFSAWLVGAGLVSWRSLRNGQWPPPYVYLDLSVFMGIWALVARANGTVAGLAAWGSLLGLALASYNQNGKDNVFTDLSGLSNALFGRQPSASALQSASGQQTPLTFATGAGTFPGASRFQGA